MSDIKEVLGKKPKVQDEDKKMAKMKALKELRSAMSGMDGEGIGKAMSMKKVTVAAPDDAKLKEGLDKAKEIVDAKPEEMMEDEMDESPEMEASESPEEENKEEDQILAEVNSPEEIDQLMKKLEEKKAQLLKK